MCKRGVAQAAVIILLAAACSDTPNEPSGGGGGGGGGNASVTVRIPLTDYGGNQTPSFFPTNVTVQAGAIVAWSNQDSTSHTTTGDNNLWNANLGPGGSYQRTFPTAGTFSYQCTLHPGMSGTVIVQ
jgi:plastocyanin